MEQGSLSKFMLLTTAYLLNIGVWTHHFASWVKVAYAILAAVVMILTLINQWHIFYKYHHSLWIVVRIEHIVKAFVPKTVRNRRMKNKSGGTL